MGDIGVPELLIILAIVIVVFGPARLAGVGRSLGQAIRAFRVEVGNADTSTESTDTTKAG